MRLRVKPAMTTHEQGGSASGLLVADRKRSTTCAKHTVEYKALYGGVRNNASAAAGATE